MKTIKFAAITAILGVLLIGNLKADILVLQYGQLVIERILTQETEGVEIKTSSGKVHWPASMIKEVRREDAEVTTNRIPSWVTIISQLATNAWAHEFKQIPATVVDKGS